MNGFTVFARKEAREILRTWRVWVLPGILAFFALTGPFPVHARDRGRAGRQPARRTQDTDTDLP